MMFENVDSGAQENPPDSQTLKFNTDRFFLTMLISSSRHVQRCMFLNSVSHAMLLKNALIKCLFPLHRWYIVYITIENNAKI